MSSTAGDKHVDHTEEAMLRLSDDIGKMADRVGDMADRIGVMADRILETQRIQSKNLEHSQEAMLEMMKIMNEQLKFNGEIMEKLVERAFSEDEKLG